MDRETSGLEWGDWVMASELVSFIQWGDHDGPRGQRMREGWWLPFLRNMARKHARGVFDAERAVVGARYGADEAAKRYMNGPDWFRDVDVPTRQAVAVELARIVAAALADGMTVETVDGYLDESDDEDRWVSEAAR